MQNFGTVKYDCFSTGADVGIHKSGESDFCQMVGSNPHLNHCITEPTMLTLQINDPSNKPHKLRVNDFVLYPRASGTGIADCRGSFELIATQDSYTHKENEWILKYENGEEVKLRFYYRIRNDGSFMMKGIYSAVVSGSFNALGGFGDAYKKKIKENCVVPTLPPVESCPLKERF